MSWKLVFWKENIAEVQNILHFRLIEISTSNHIDPHFWKETLNLELALFLKTISNCCDY